MRLSSHAALISIAGVLALQLVGCGQSGPQLVDVTGTVTLDGNPLPKVGVVFRPTGPGASPAYGGTNKEGNYKLLFSQDKTGAMPGEYEVDLEVTRYSKSEIEQMKADGNEPPPPVTIPKKYRQAGALKATVKPGESNVINFELTSK